MKKLLLVALLFGSLFSISLHANAGIKKDPSGTWKCSVPDAPYQYQEFNLVISKENKQYSGKISAGGYEMPCNSVTYAKRKLEVKLNVQGTDVTISVKVKAKSFAGNVGTPDGDLKITAARVVGKK